ncbi:MAG: hypothetical protein MJA31_15530 [Clostridia bacterium]|nr:hypothetical protein [Clostridia bacterium]
MERIRVLNESKFERLTKAEMTNVKGGWGCLSCKKRSRKIPISVRIEPSGHTVSV